MQDSMLSILMVNTCSNVRAGKGMAERTMQVSRFLLQNGLQCRVLCLDIDVTHPNSYGIASENIIALPTISQRFFIPKFNFRLINFLVKNADVIHIMGHWTLLNAVVYLYARHLKKPYVICPAGSLPVVGRSKIIKRLYNYFIGDSIIHNADTCVGITQQEIEYFHHLGIPDYKISLIPNGICKDDFNKPHSELIKYKNDRPTNKKFILFMGRLNYIKGPDILLNAFLQIHEIINDYDLVFCGPDEGMKISLLNFINEHHCLNSRVHFFGDVGAYDRQAVYQMADVLVVPSRQEAMSIVALEASICNIPVIITDMCGFNEIASIDQDLVVPASPEGIAKALSILLLDPSRLQLAGQRCQELAQNYFTWQIQVSKYIELYQRLLNKNPS